MTDLRLSLKDMCARFVVTPRTLRHYEYIELIAPERVGKARFYGLPEVERMKKIMRGRGFGFSLEEIRQWLQYDDQGAEMQLSAFAQFANHQLVKLQSELEDVSTKIRELRLSRDEAVLALEQWAQCDRLERQKVG